MVAWVLDILFGGVLLFLALGAGLTVLRALRCRLGTFDAVALGLPLGLGLISLLFLVIGLVHQLDRATLGIAGFGLAFFAFAESVRVYRDRRSGTLKDAWQTIQRLPVFPLFVCVVVALASLLCTRAPVTDGDALCYHLLVPRVFLDSKRLTFDPDLHETVYPLLVENLFGVALAFRGSVACRIVSWILGIALAIGVGAMARRWLGRQAVWASAIVLAVPAISNGMAAPLNDVTQATFCQAALLAALLWWERPSNARAVLIGLLAGLSLGVKYPALVWVGMLGCLMICVGLSTKLRRCRVGQTRDRMAWDLMKQLAIFAGVVLLTGGVWYLRAYLATGNPVYPFFKQAFGGAGLDVVLEPAKRPLNVNAWNLVTALVPMTLDPDRFDSYSHQFGPIFLMLLPGLLLFRARGRLMVLVLFAFGFYTACLTQRQSMRFLLPALGPWAVGSAWVLCRLRNQTALAARASVFLAMLVMIGEAGLAVARVRHAAPVLLGHQDDQTYLAQREPTFVVGQWIDANLPETARIIGQDHRGFYIPRPYTMELAHRRRTGLGQNGATAAQIVATLGQEGFTHLLMCPPVPEDAVEFDPWLSRALAPWLESQVSVFQADLTDGDGVLRHYGLYELPNGRSLKSFQETLP